MAETKPVYLIAGDDAARLDAWRTRVRGRAESEGGPGALERFDATVHPPAAVAGALAALTFGTGQRYLLVEGVEAWKEKELDPLLGALAHMPPETVLVILVAGAPAKKLVAAVESAGGEVRQEKAPKPWELPKWVVERAREQGLRLDAEAAKVLVAAIGPRQQRLVRELEKLVLIAHPRTQLSAEEVADIVVGESSSQAFDLADALVTGDLRGATSIAESLRDQDERPARLLWSVVRRLREVHRAAELLDAGVPEKSIGSSLKLPPWAAKKILAKAKQADREAVERALIALADLEIDLRSPGGVDEDTAFTLALQRAAA